MTRHYRNEAKTRKELIDPALAKAGWDIDNARQVLGPTRPNGIISI